MEEKEKAKKESPMVIIDRLIVATSRLRDKMKRYVKQIPELSDVIMLLDDVVDMLKDILVYYE